MGPRLTAALLIGMAVGSGIMAGIFFAFSNFVMRGLDRLPPAMSISAMQSINLVVLNPVFKGTFFGTAIIALALIVLLIGWRQPAWAWMLTAGLSYLLGIFAVTAIGNVPLNDALAAVDPTRPDADSEWRKFLIKWMAWNHLRTVAGIIALAASVVALRSTPATEVP